MRVRGRILAPKLLFTTYLPLVDLHVWVGGLGTEVAWFKFDPEATPQAHLMPE